MFFCDCTIYYIAINHMVVSYLMQFFILRFIVHLGCDLQFCIFFCLILNNNRACMHVLRIFTFIYIKFLTLFCIYFHMSSWFICFDTVIFCYNVSSVETCAHICWLTILLTNSKYYVDDAEYSLIMKSIVDSIFSLRWSIWHSIQIWSKQMIPKKNMFCCEILI